MRSFGAFADRPLAGGRDEHDLVVGRVEADVVARDVVEDDEVEVLLGEHPALALEPRLALLGAEADEHRAVLASRRAPREDVLGRLEA